MKTKTVLSSRLRALREERELTLKQVATAIGASDAAVCNWENGAAEPKASYLCKLATFYDCTADFLLGKTDDFDAPKPSDPLLFSISNAELQLLAVFRELSPDLQQLLTNTAKTWKNNHAAEPRR